LSGRVRQQLLNEATASGQADRVLAFFRSYQQEAGGTHAAPTAPGRARSAPSGKQTYTRDMIGQLYERHRKGEFTEAAWSRIEQDIFQAQHENRIQGVYLTK
jgi:hypothetical protein